MNSCRKILGTVNRSINLVLNQRFFQGGTKLTDFGVNLITELRTRVPRSFENDQFDTYTRADFPNLFCHPSRLLQSQSTSPRSQPQLHPRKA